MYEAADPGMDRGNSGAHFLLDIQAVFRLFTRGGQMAKTIKVRCPKCGGNGYNGRKCPVCHGSGHIKEPHEHLRTNYKPPEDPEAAKFKDKKVNLIK